MKYPFRTTIAMALWLVLSGLALVAQPPAPQAASIESATTIPSSQSTAETPVRIVRLSEVQGEVDVYRGTGEGYEEALLNQPITQGTELRTRSGLAEVEFEDNSTLRLAPDTIVEFLRLERNQTGVTATTVEVASGTVYVSLARTAGNEFMLTFADQQAVLAPSNHVRLLVTPTWASLAVLDGAAKIATPAGITAVVKKKTVNFQFLTPTKISLNKNTDAPYDDWDNGAIEYHKHYAKNSAYGTAASLYGISDMNYYGSFIDVAGCERLWRPYFANASWDPFANGNWVWYQGSGWTWVSPYPWGWTPYHYGVWDYCPAYGWGWRPRGSWHELVNIPKPPRHAQPHYPLLPIPRPPHPPSAGAPTVVAVNRKPPVSSGLSSPGKFVIRQDSAGLGVPRGTLGNLSHISEQAAHHGSASIGVNSAPMIVDHGRGSNAMYVSSGRTSRGIGSASYSSARSGGGSYSGGGERSYASDAGRGAISSGSVSAGGGSSGGRK